MDASPAITLATGCRPGAVGRIAEMHGRYYVREWNFGSVFETRVATGLAAFVDRMDPGRDLLLLALAGETIVGSLIVDCADPASMTGQDDRGAHIRWFILDDSVRGTGIGRQMMRKAVEHIDVHAGGRAWLTTFAGLDAAQRLYESFGFRLAEERRDRTWGTEVAERLYLRP